MGECLEGGKIYRLTYDYSTSHILLIDMCVGNTRNVKDERFNWSLRKHD